MKPALLLGSIAAAAWLAVCGLIVAATVRSMLADLRAPVATVDVDFAVRQRLAVERARREYPDLWDEGSPLRRAVSAAYERAVTDLDEELLDPEFPYVLARRMADRMGVEAER